MTRDILDLGGQAALVTGAGQGAGRAIALALAEHNAAVAVNDFVLERAEAVVAEIVATGGRAIAVQADVGDLASVRAAHERATDALGAITLLVNNAGNAGPRHDITMEPEFWESDPANWGRYFETNLFGVMNCCHVAMPAMAAARRGRVVTIVSDSARVGEPRLAVYGAAKAGAAGFVRGIAKEAGRYNVTCNAIALGSLDTLIPPDQLAAHLATERTKAQLSRYTIRRLGTAADVAALTLFLCSDASSWITGQTYPLNGGYSVAT